ncbi:hypothetical protein TWF696_002584 [Orbilia brochopaga]|uniref:F-box domain-containing protein n=1 Tax=Orbilia brochopaga TaxID=3140254 RepID=A0AAV9U630_9PEZI
MTTTFNASLEAWNNVLEMHNAGPNASSPPIFFVREILDRILSHLPARDIMHACRPVCREWNQLIKLTYGQPVDNVDVDAIAPVDPVPLPVEDIDAIAPVDPVPDPLPPPARPLYRPREQVRVVTPAALDVLSVFWHAVAEAKVGVHREAKVKKNADWGILPSRRSRLREALKEPLRALKRHIDPPREEKEYRKMRVEIHKLYELFAPVVLAIPFSDTDTTDDERPMEIVVKGATDWAYICRHDFEDTGRKILRELRPAESLGIPKPWADTMHLMVAAAYGYSPSGTMDHGTGDGMFEGVRNWLVLQTGAYERNWQVFGAEEMEPSCSLMFSGEGLGPWRRLTLGYGEKFEISLDHREYMRVPVVRKLQ